MPPERLEQDRDELSRNTRRRQQPSNFNSESDVPWSTAVEVVDAGNGRPRFTVDSTWDDERIDVGW